MLPAFAFTIEAFFSTEYQSSERGELFYTARGGGQDCVLFGSALFGKERISKGASAASTRIIASLILYGGISNGSQAVRGKIYN